MRLHSLLPRIGCAMAVVLLVANGSWAQPAGMKKVTSVEGITEYALDNGMQVLIFPDPSKPTITVNITYRVGSRHEGRGEAGMAHLLEHMVFKGTPTYENIWGALEDHGANFNGTTWVDRTNYYETLPATPDNLDFALKMEADRMINSLISGEELAREMTVVRNEFERGENSPSAVLSERMMSAACLWHNYGKSTIGNRSDIERVPVDNLRRFYKKYYQPDNATLLVAGKFDPEKVLELISKYFAPIPRPERVLETTYTEEPAQDGPRLVTLKRVGDVANVGSLYHIPSGSHEDFAAIEILEDILTNQPAGRLYRGLVVNGMATRVSGAAFSWAEPGVMQIDAEVSSGQEPEAVLGRLIELIEGIAKTKITEKEVEAAITRRKKSIKLAMTNSSRIGIRMSESISQGDWRLFFIHRDRVEQVTVADVKRVAEKYLVETNRTAGMFIPTKTPSRTKIPGRPDVSGLVSGYQGKAEISQGEEIKPEVSYIESRVTRSTLPSGIKLAIMPLETRGDAVQATFRFHYGTEAALTGKTTALGMISRMLMRGTERLDYEALRNEIDQLESRVSVGGGVGAFSGRIQSDRKNFVAAIKLLGEILKTPRFDQDEFDIIVKGSRNRIEQGMSDPQTLGMQALSRAVNPFPADSIHYVPSLEESLDRLNAVTLDQVRSLYKQFYGASNVEVAIVGDFDKDAALAEIENQFAQWKSPAPYERIAKPFKPIEADEITIDTPDKEMAMIAMASVVPMKDDDPKYPAMVFSSYVLGRSAKSRLLTRLRHKGGLSYGAGGGFNASARDERGSLTGYAICAPQNAEKAKVAMKEEIDKWIADGLTAEELEEAKVSYDLNFRRSLGSESYLLSELASGLELGRSLQYRQDLMDAVQGLSLSEIKETLNSVLMDAPMVSVSAGDQTAAKEKAEAPAAKEAADAKMPGLPVQVAQFDKNKDGKLQKDELPGPLAGAMAQLDKNGDGAIDGSEFPKPPPGAAKNMFAMFDKNNDGSLQKDELPGQLQGVFKKLDADSNGSIDLEELQAAMGG